MSRKYLTKLKGDTVMPKHTKRKIFDKKTKDFTKVFTEKDYE